MQNLSERLFSAPFLLKGEPAFLSSLIRSLPTNPVVLEIGTFRGLTAVLMAQQRKDIKVITIDPHIGVPEMNLYSNPFIVKSNFEKYNMEKQITHYPVASEEYEPSEAYDLIFIDGNHSFESVSHDYYKFEPFVKPGGFIVFHDFGSHEGVSKFCSGLIPLKEWICKSMFVIKKK